MSWQQWLAQRKVHLHTPGKQELEGLREVELTYQGRRFLLRSQFNGEASVALRAAGAAAPPTLREVSASAA